MFENIVIGVDGKDGGHDAVLLASVLGRGAEKWAVVHVSAADAPHIVEYDRELLGRPDADLVLVDDAEEIGPGLDRVAAERGADLVVIGSVHHGALGRVLMGDEAADILHHATRPVALAPKGYREHPAPPKTVGVAYNGAPDSVAALELAERLASFFGAELRALAIADPDRAPVPVGDGGGEEQPASDDLVARTREELGSLDNVELDVVAGSAEEELVAFSERVDLLLCGSRHNSAIKRLTVGSTSDHLAHNAKCPLIVTPNSAE
jgi:nucleotide-binding universal stress UspA family protein